MRGMCRDCLELGRGRHCKTGTMLQDVWSGDGKNVPYQVGLINKQTKNIGVLDFIRTNIYIYIYIMYIHINY